MISYTLSINYFSLQPIENNIRYSILLLFVSNLNITLSYVTYSSNVFLISYIEREIQFYLLNNLHSMSRIEFGLCGLT